MNILPSDICDFHAHILPGADHGSYSIETSIAQLRLAQRCGVSRIVASPHFYAHKESVSSFLHRRNASFDLLKPHIPKGMTVVCGAEVLLCDNMEKLPGLEALTPGNSKVLLVELPFSVFKDSYYVTLTELMERGFKIILAHPHKYDPDIIDELVDMGAALQLNTDSVSSLFSKNRNSLRWLKSGAVSCFGSDIHEKDKSAYRNFYLAVKRNIQHAMGVKEKSDLLWSEFKAE